MPIPNTINDLDTNPNNNSPQGSENVGPNANGYIQALGAFIKQIATGVGFAPTSDVNMGGKKLTNLGAGSTTSTSTDAITGAQARALAYKVGEVKMWHGAIANIAATWGAGWQLCDGTNGTADLRDRFIVGAGTSYAPGNTGGLNLNALSIAQLPAHNHGVNESPHVHGLNDFGHGHTSGAHNHGTGSGFPFWTSTSGGGASTNFTGGSNSINLENTTGNATVTINSSTSNISMNGASTGISTLNTGSGAAIENRPPYYALCFIEYTGIGA
jgi:hypothetical protein